MKALVKLTLLALFVFTLSGCFQVERVVTVRPDGSGTVEETVRFSQKILQAFTAAFQTEESAKDAAKQPAGPDLYDEESLKKTAANMGVGVSYVRSQPVNDANFTGYRVVYAFKDINQLRMESGVPSPNKNQGGAPAKEEGTKFIFSPATAGKPAILQLKTPKLKKAPETAETAQPVPAAETKPAAQPSGESNQKDMEMLKEMLGGLRFALTVVVDGKIVETNATHREQNRIILADMDFSRLFNLSQQDLEKINAVKDEDMASAMAALKDIPGVKVDLNDELRVQFR